MVMYDGVLLCNSQSCLFILASKGHLILSVDKDTYQVLGLSGKPSKFTGLDPSRYSKSFNVHFILCKFCLKYKFMMKDK